MHAKFQDDTLSGSEFMQRRVKIWPSSLNVQVRPYHIGKLLHCM